MVWKMLTVGCFECNWTEETDDSQDNYDEMLDLERCPRCDKNLIEDI